jgi:transposase InsO family protein
MKEIDNTQEQLRIRAIELFNKKWKVTDICSNLNCSRAWFYKWLKRYQTNDPEWYKEQSKAPKTKSKKTDSDMEQTVLKTREFLASKPYYQYGPQAIYYALSQKGINPPPVWTISRILKRHRITKSRRTTAYIPKGKVYPYADHALCQQMDFVGPRYLSSKTRFYFHNLICCDTHYSQVSAYTSQSAENVCNSLIRFWKVAGIPDFLQMDNYLSFWGSLIKPEALGKVIRLCLLHGVTPIFIPVKEPWRNGIIEHFNKKMQSAILSAGEYTNIEELQKASDSFSEIHNQTHYYSKQEGMTPNKRMKYLEYPLNPLDKKYAHSLKHIPLEQGEVFVLRFIRSDLKFNIFGLSYTLPEETKYEYVKGIIVTDKHHLIIFKEQKYITEFELFLYQ